MKYINLKNLVKEPFFRKSDILIRNAGIFDYQLSQWNKKGYIKRIKSGFYVFTEDMDVLDSRTVSFLLYEPSYISMESALSYYGLIPEIVPTITCLSTKKTNTFINNYGKFIYRHIKSDLFWGYVIIDTRVGKYLLAEPEKALLDYIYFNQKRLRNKDDINELRINGFEFKKTINISKLKIYLSHYSSPTMNHIVNLINNHVDSESNQKYI